MDPPAESASPSSASATLEAPADADSAGEPEPSAENTDSQSGRSGDGEHIAADSEGQGRKERAQSQDKGPEGSMGETKISLESFTAMQKESGPGGATGPQPHGVQGFHGGHGLSHGSASAQFAKAHTPQVVVYNMSQINTIGLFSTAKVELDTEFVRKAPAVTVYLNDGMQPPPANLSERVAEIEARIESQMWDGISKRARGCTRCPDLVEQAVRVFW
jgi:hypothetical protein